MDPNDDQPLFYQKVKDILMESDNLFHIVCEDFYISLNQNLDTDNYKHTNNPKSRDFLLKMMSELDLIDYYRVLHQTTKSFTWRKKNPFKQARLDFFLIS